MTRSSRRRSTAGFTLLEAVIAMALMGMVLAALATITSQWMPSWNHGMVRLQRDEQLALGLERVAADVSAAEFVSANRATQEPYFEGAERSVTFVRTALGPNSGSGLELVRLAEVRSEQGPALVRTRAAFTRAVAGDRRGQQPVFANPVVLLRPPYRLMFSYAGTDRIWRETWSSQLALPAAVKLNVYDNVNRTTHSSSTAILLHMEIPQSCIAVRSLDHCLTTLQPQPQDGRART